MFRLIPLMLLSLALAACGAPTSSAPGDAATGTDAATPDDAPVDFADLMRVCALEAACLGTFGRLNVTNFTTLGCADTLAGQLTRMSVDGALTVRPNDPGPGEYFTYQEQRSDPTPVREALRRARTATTCADYVGPQYARWARCRREGSHCDGDLRVACGPSNLPAVTDCSSLGGCDPVGVPGPCRTPPTACSIPARDYVRCDGDSIRVGCGEPIACPAGSRCTATVAEMAMGTGRVLRILAACSPSAPTVRLRCPDGSMVDAPGRTCPADPAGACTASRCDGSRLSLCLNGRGTEVDCAALTGGACEETTCSPR